MSSLSRQILEKWVGEIEVPDGSNCLDVGGSQNPIQKRLKNKGENTKYKILDLEVPHECKQKPDIIMDLNYNSLFLSSEGRGICYESGIFDIVFCLEVSEYWWNPVQALENINAALKKNGILYLSSHFIYPVHNPVKDDILRYTPKGIEKLLEKTGFEVLENTPRILTEGKYFYGNLVGFEKMRPAKGEDLYICGSLIKAKKS